MTQPVQQAPVAGELFTWADGAPALVGARCGDCGVVTFPRQAGCPRCTGERMADEVLARRGTLWTWTVQGFPPPPPARLGDTPLEPYGVGYVELPGQVRVEARLTEHDPARLRIGMEMELVLQPLGRRPDGAEVVTFAFRPVAS